MHRALSLFALGLLAACPGACPGPSPDDGGPSAWPLDTVLGEGEVRCGPVTDERELIGGTLAYGQVGHAWRCHNSQIRFLLQGPERPFGNSSRGGNLIDVDRVRADEGEPGADTFREHVVAFGVREVEVESIEVIDDGRSGEQGVLRVRGRPGDLTLAPQAALLAQDLPATLQTDYVLKPDSDVIEITTTVFNEGDDQLYGVLFADFVAFGGATDVMTPTTGLGELAYFEEVPYLAAGGALPGEGASYAYVCPDSDATVIFAASGITGPMCDDPIVSAEASYTRLLVVGDGTVESVSRRARELRGLPTGTITGQVRTHEGEPAAGVFVAALEGGGPLDEDAVAVGRTRTDEEGRYALSLGPAEVRIVAYQPGELRAASDPLFVEDGTEAEVDLELPAPATLQLSIAWFDGSGSELEPLPGKFTVEALEGAYQPSPALGEYASADTVRSVPTADGTASLVLSPGRYRVWASRGFEFTRRSVEVDLAAGALEEVELELTRVVATEGLLAAEFHQHTLASTDGSTPLRLKVLENAAEGVEVAASTDHDNVVDFGPLVEELGLWPFLTVVPGSEVSFQAVGHFNVYPFDVDPADPFANNGARLWWGQNLPDLFADLRERAGDPVIQLNHVRRGGSGSLATLRFNPAEGTWTVRDPPTLPGLPPDVYERFPTDFEAIEVNRDLGQPAQFTAEGWAALSAAAPDDPGAIPSLADLFGLLGAGLPVAATANSDSHHPAEGVGWPRTYLDMGTDDPAGVPPASITEAVRAQKTWGAHGCLIELLVGGERRAGLGEATPASELGQVSVRVQAPPWVEISSVEVYRNGIVQPLVLDEQGLRIDPDGELSAALPAADEGATVRLDASLSDIESGDLVLLAVARGGSLAPVAPGSASCFTAPLYVQEGGEWTGWLADTQTIRE